MGWFGGGSSSNDSSGASASSTSISNTDPMYDDYSAAPSAGSGMEMSGGTNDLQQFSTAIQQQMIVEQVVTKLTEASFEKCIQGKPSESLSGRESACIYATVGKWLDTSEFMRGRMEKMQQQGGSGFS